MMIRLPGNLCRSPDAVQRVSDAPLFRGLHNRRASGVCYDPGSAALHGTCCAAPGIRGSADVSTIQHHEPTKPRAASGHRNRAGPRGHASASSDPPPRDVARPVPRFLGGDFGRRGRCRARSLGGGALELAFVNAGPRLPARLLADQQRSEVRAFAQRAGRISPTPPPTFAAAQARRRRSPAFKRCRARSDGCRRRPR